MAEVSAPVTGLDRAAILLLSLGEEHAVEILKHMGPKEVQKLGGAMASLSDVSQEQMDGVLMNFLESVGRHTALGMDSEGYVRTVLIDALGKDKAGNVIDRILLGGNAQGLESLKWMEPRAVVEVIRAEHPQIIAIVLSYLDGDQAGEILSLLPENLQVDIMMRIATLDSVQPGALQELNLMLEKQLSGASNVQSAAVGGVKRAANLLNFVEGSVSSALMEKMAETDSDLSQLIQDQMFVFENLIEVDDAGFQTLLREVSSENLLLAMKGAEEEMKEKFYKNMSKRAAEMMRDDLEAKGPVRLSEVEGAQKEIVTIARRLADDGEIMLGGQGGEEFV